MSPVASTLHEIASRWLIDVLRLPAGTGAAFVSGATVANASCLAAARDELARRAGWDVQSDGLFGAPPISVVVGAHAHSTLSKSLGLVGLGRNRVVVVPADDQGRLRADELPDLRGPVLVCAQAGEVNTGAFDPFDEIADWLAERGGWLHVDGAFGLWALADPTRSAARARPRPRRLVGHRRGTNGSTSRTTAASCSCAIRPTLAAHVRRPRRLPAAGRPLRGDAPHAAIVAAGPSGGGVGRAAHARSARRRRTGAAGVRVRHGDRRAPRGGRADDPQRRRAQPGAGALSATAGAPPP